MTSDDNKNNENGKQNANGSPINGSDHTTPKKPSEDTPNAPHQHSAQDDGKVLHFPTLADRDRLRKDKQKAEETARKTREKQEQIWRADYKARKQSDTIPFLNVEKIPMLVRWIVPVMLLVHIAQSLFLNADQSYLLMWTFGFVPAQITAGFATNIFISPFTYAFLHGSWMHFGVNALMLAALATAFERDFGPRANLGFFVLSTLIGAVFFFALNPTYAAPLVGASASVSAYFASFLMMMHYRGAAPAIGNLSRYGIWPLMAFWLFLTVGLGILMGGGASISWEAHLGGFLTGVFFTSYKVRRSLKFW